jgi:hypothetical protein
MFKFCPRCQRNQPVNYFNWKKLNVRRQVYCKDCSRKYIREHYYKNVNYYLIKVNKRNKILEAKFHEYIGMYLSTHPCVDCGETNIIVLEFDHRERLDKRMEVSKIYQRRMSLESLIKEVAKCDVRCSNCHRKKTAKESGSWKIAYQKLYNTRTHP